MYIKEYKINNKYFTALIEITNCFNQNGTFYLNSLQSSVKSHMLFGGEMFFSSYELAYILVIFSAYYRTWTIVKLIHFQWVILINYFVVMMLRANTILLLSLSWNYLFIDCKVLLKYNHHHKAASIYYLCWLKIYKHRSIIDNFKTLLYEVTYTE